MRMIKKQEEDEVARLLEVKNLHTRFKVRDGYIYAVNGVSFNLDKGEMLGVVGESGCGKSVAMMSLIKLLPPSAEVTDAEIVLDGEDITHATAGRSNAIRGSKVGMIFQDPMTSLNPFMKIGTQLCEGIVHHKKMKKADAMKQAAKYLDLVGISNSEHRLQEYPHQLSGGMRQRVMIAMALLSEPSLVIADEPTTALDVTIQAQIVELIKDLRTKLKMSIIWITHDLSLLAGMVDRIMVMYAGAVVEEAALDDLYKSPRHPYTIGLLKSIPSLTSDSGSRLPSIGGAPPNLYVKPSSCPFALRCSHKVDRCEKEMPALEPIPGSVGDSCHRAACWVDVREGGVA
jgi:oligopeptide/dipeptide ABC transporter ATP-binding protein